MLNRLLRWRSDAPAIPDTLWREVKARHTFIGTLPPDVERALRQLSERFLQQKVFAGARSFEPDNLVRVSIAAQACLPILKLGLESYSGWSGIIVYPGEFVIPRREPDEDGVVHEYDEEALGEAWPDGPVVLSWYDDPDDYAGANVVIHEFAHKLDLLSGEADGLPPLHAGMSVETWCDVLDAAYEDFCARVDADEDLPIDPYAAEHPAEFFAVASEIFFTEPQLLKNIYPDFYGQLSAFYRQNPASY